MLNGSLEGPYWYGWRGGGFLGHCLAPLWDDDCSEQFLNRNSSSPSDRRQIVEVLVSKRHDEFLQGLLLLRKAANRGDVTYRVLNSKK